MLSAVVVAPWNEAAQPAADAVQQGLQLRLRTWRVTSAAAASRRWFGWRGTVVIVLDRGQSAGEAAGTAALRKALHEGLTIVPVLIDGALMPEPATLPADLQHFPFLNAVLGTREQWTALLDRVAEAVQSPATHEEPSTPSQFAARVLAAAYPSALCWSVGLGMGMLAAFAIGRWRLDAGKGSPLYAMAVLAIALPLCTLGVACRRLGWWGVLAAGGYLLVLILGLSFLTLVLEGIVGSLLSAAGVANDSPARITFVNAIFPALVVGTLLAGRAIRRFRATPGMAAGQLAARTALLGSLALGLLLAGDLALRLAAAASGPSFSDLNAAPSLLSDTMAITSMLQLALLAGTALGVADALFKVWRGGPPVA